MVGRDRKHKVQGDGNREISGTIKQGEGTPASSVHKCMQPGKKAGATLAAHVVTKLHHWNNWGAVGEFTWLVRCGAWMQAQQGTQAESEEDWAVLCCEGAAWTHRSLLQKGWQSGWEFGRIRGEASRGDAVVCVCYHPVRIRNWIKLSLSNLRKYFPQIQCCSLQEKQCLILLPIKEESREKPPLSR